MTTPALVLLVPLLAVLGVAPPDPPSKALPLPSVEEVLRRYEAAVGDAKTRAGLTAWRAIGTTDLSGDIGPFTITRQRPDRVRLEVTIEGRRILLAHDGEMVWQEGVGEGPPQAVPMEPEPAARFREEWADFDGPLIDPKSKGLEVSVAGWEPLDGRRALRVDVKFPSGRVHQWFLDAETYRPVQRITPNRHPRRGDVPRVWFYVDYETVAGVVVPREIEREDSQMVRGYRLRTFEPNPAIDPAIFRLPPGVRPETVP